MYKLDRPGPGMRAGDSVCNLRRRFQGKIALYARDHCKGENKERQAEKNPPPVRRQPAVFDTFPFNSGRREDSTILLTNFARRLHRAFL